MQRSVDERLLSLAAFLTHSGRRRTLEEVRAAFPDYKEGEAGRMMFIRDKAELLNAGFPVEEADDRYWIDRDRLYIDDVFFEDTERAALLVALLSVRHGLTALPAVGATLGGFGDLQTGLGGTTELLQADLNVEGRVQTLNAAVAGRQLVSGTYAGKVRTLEPYGLLLRRGAWYLRARDVDDGEAKNFRVDRFESEPVAIRNHGAFRPPADLDLTAALPVGWQLPTDVAYDVVVDIDEHLAGRASFEVADHGSVEWRADGSIRVTMTVNHLGAFRSWLFSYLEHAVVVSPEEVRDDVRSWLHALVEAT